MLVVDKEVSGVFVRRPEMNLTIR